MSVIRLHVPSPSEHPQLDDHMDAPDVRRLHCTMYNQCLTVAYKLDWPGFSCNDCRAFVSFSRDDLRADAEAIADMLNALPRQREVKG